ncbi:DMT family transporter [Actinoplanes sp. NBC_00393]|uniref:DMT family transporter n=1 Tax=Actinoplanes sp. NBC_00393 TaxID=2975953 RepID=UPI002E1E7F84
MTDRLLFALLTTGWGASFFFTAIALRSFTPVGVVVLRMALAAAVLTGVVLIRRPPLPAQRAAGHLVVLGGFNIALPFLLLTAAQQHVTSSLTVVLSATTPVFVFLFAGLLRAEPFSGRRLLGVALSFAGVTVLSGWHGGGAGSWGWPLVVVLSSALYAAGNVYTRRHLAGLNPLVIAWGQITASLLYLLPAAALAGGVWPAHSPGLLPLLAVLELGVFASAFCYLLFFRFILRWGSSATSFNTYLQPIVGIALGVLVLGESVNSRQWVALALILGGLAVFASEAVRGIGRGRLHEPGARRAARTGR